MIKKTSSLPKITPQKLEQLILAALNDRKAEAIVSISLTGKSDVADRMVIASGTSTRHVSALADAIVETLKNAGYEHVPVEGQELCEWVLVDAGDVIVHLFKPEVREHYHLEKMWSVSIPKPVEKGR